MTEDGDTPATREELLAAREQLIDQIALIEYPIRSSDRNPPLLARLKAMLAEINELLNRPNAEDD
jgi:hypothetical protein